VFAGRMTVFGPVPPRRFGAHARAGISGQAGAVRGFPAGSGFARLRVFGVERGLCC